MFLPKFLSFFTVFTLAVSVCQASDFNKTAPPNTVGLYYPDGDLTVGETLQVSQASAGLVTLGSFYGFAWYLSTTIVLPDGTDGGQGIIESNATTCAGSGPAGPGPGVVILHTTSTGMYTILWNVTYGTSTDPTIANQTHCDPNRLSYETFTFNKSINVVTQTVENPPTPASTQDIRTINPTGFIMVKSNGAGVVASSVLLVAVGIVVVSLLTV